MRYVDAQCVVAYALVVCWWLVWVVGGAIVLGAAEE